MTPALQTVGLSKRFGGFTATDGVDLAIAPGSRHALIGPNGAGKTTLVNLLTGLLAPSAGRVLLGGHDVTRLPQHARVGRGLARSFQINRLFAEMSVLESVLMAVNERRGAGGRFWRPAAANTEALEEAAGLLARLGLGEVADRRTGSLPYGQQRLIEIALALATRPRVLLLDEPAAGVSTHEGRALFDTLAGLPPETTILLIEHDMELVFRFADRISVLVGGRVLAEDRPERIAADPAVRRLYLGEAAA